MGRQHTVRVGQAQAIRFQAGAVSILGIIAGERSRNRGLVMLVAEGQVLRGRTYRSSIELWNIPNISNEYD